MPGARSLGGALGGSLQRAGGRYVDFTQRKEGLDLRPVAVGLTWRRLACKVGLRAFISTIQEKLEPIQVGVGTKGGCEAVVHAFSAKMDEYMENPAKAGLLVDNKNAFVLGRDSKSSSDG